MTGHSVTPEDRTDEQLVTMLHRLGYQRYMRTPRDAAEIVAAARQSLALGRDIMPVDIAEAHADELRKAQREGST